MAGSYRHCDDHGTFQFDLIENLGDAHEACEMMHFMIRSLAGGDERRIEDAEDAYFRSVNPSYIRRPRPPEAAR